MTSIACLGARAASTISCPDVRHRHRRHVRTNPDTVSDTDAGTSTSPSPSPTPTSSPTSTPTPISTPTPTPTSPTPTPTPTTTGADSSAGSINDLAKQRFNQMITNRVLGTVLLGINEQVNCNDCVSAFGSAGSFSAGIHGRKNLTANLSLLAGIAYTHYSEGGYSVTSAPIGAFALRYDFVDWGSSRPFFDIGAILTPYEKVRYRRSYTTSLGAVSLDSKHHRRQLRRLWPRGLDQPAVAARRGRSLRRSLAVVAAGEGLYRSGRARSIRSTPRSPAAPTRPISSRSAASGRICSATASRPISMAASCNPLERNPASSPP